MLLAGEGNINGDRKLMVMRLSIIALGAFCCLFSGCGCSKEKKESDVPSRMQDASYTNQLQQLQGRQTALAKQMTVLQEKIGKLGAEAKAAGTPEYVDLTNRLAQCKSEAERIRKEALVAIRARIMKESDQKRNLKK